MTDKQDVQLEEMQEEILESFPLEGVLLYPQQRFHDFKTFSAMMDFAQVFKIYSGQYGQLSNGTFHLIYNSSEV